MASLMRVLMMVVIAFSFLATETLAPSAMAQSAMEGTGLPLPRFVSLRAGKANLRTGPGVQYPVEWVYQKAGAPLEIIAEYRHWRKIRDWEGSQGWIHQNMLSGKRGLIITGKLRTVRKEPTSDSAAVIRAEQSVVGRLVACPKSSAWCRVEIDGFVGWLRRMEFWGAYEDEEVR